MLLAPEPQGGNKKAWALSTSVGQGLYCLVPVSKELGQDQRVAGDCGENMKKNFGTKALGSACEERTDRGNTVCTHRKTDALPT